MIVTRGLPEPVRFTRCLIPSRPRRATTLRGPRPSERVIDVGGVRTRYVTAGRAGSTLVLLHGDGESAGDWRWSMPALARSHRVLALDLSGHGGTGPLEAYSPVRLARFVREVLDTVGVDRATLVGNSLGGLVAIHLTLDQPHRVERLILVDSAGLGRTVGPLLPVETLNGLGQTAIAMARAPGGPVALAALRAGALFAQPWRVPAGWWTDQVRLALSPRALEASVAAKRELFDLLGQSHVVLHRLAEVAVPTLVVWGLFDLVVPVSHALAAVRRLPHGRLSVLPDCGHLPQVERPDEFARVVTAFLDRTEMAVGTAASA